VKNKQTIISIGVDVGTVNGAISIIDDNMKIKYLSKVPILQTEIKSRRNKSKLNKETMKYEADFRKRSWVNFKEIGEAILPYLPKGSLRIYTIERLIPRSGEGESSSFVNGNSLGVFQGLYTLINPTAYYEPLPITWEKEPGLSSDKSLSIELGEDIYQVKLKDYVKKGKLDDIAEALLLAFYGLKMFYDEKNKKGN
jgi:hypothetical protein